MLPVIVWPSLLTPNTFLSQLKLLNNLFCHVNKSNLCWYILLFFVPLGRRAGWPGWPSAAVRDCKAATGDEPWADPQGEQEGVGSERRGIRGGALQRPQESQRWAYFAAFMTKSLICNVLLFLQQLLLLTNQPSGSSCSLTNPHLPTDSPPLSDSAYNWWVFSYQSPDHPI